MEILASLPPLALAAIGTGFTFLMTAAGSAMVFLMPNGANLNIRRIFLGFAAGVMIAASVWSLIIPSIDRAAENGQGLLPTVGGFVLGVAFLLLLDILIPHLHPGSTKPEGPKTRMKGSSLLVFAVTLHNIPEGMAVGLACAMAATGQGTVAAALALCIGMGLQNFPEGAAVSLPLKDEGFSKLKAFVYGSLSGLVEPVGGVLAVLVAGGIAPLMPWFLAFAAGAMMYVVIEELIPEAHLGDHSNSGTLGALAGFVIMMVLDIALG